MAEFGVWRLLVLTSAIMLTFCFPYQWLQSSIKRARTQHNCMKAIPPRWTTEEDKELLELLKNNVPLSTMADQLNRTSCAVSQRHSKLIRHERTVTRDKEIKLMTEVVQLTREGITWREIQQTYFPNRSLSSVKKLGLKLRDGTKKKYLPGEQRRFAWTQEESELLKQGVAKYGTKWTRIVAEFLPHRSRKACLEHWTYSLNGVQQSQPLLHFEKINTTAEVQVSKAMPMAPFQRMLQRLNRRAAQEFIHDQLVKATNDDESY